MDDGVRLDLLAAIGELERARHAGKAVDVAARLDVAVRVLMPALRRYADIGLVEEVEASPHWSGRALRLKPSYRLTPEGRKLLESRG